MLYDWRRTMQRTPALTGCARPGGLHKMRSLILGLVFSLAALAGGTSLAAQEGHPLKGSWIGTWEGNKAQGNDVLVILNWDGKAITGVINPGTDNMEIKNATLNPDGWQVHLDRKSTRLNSSHSQISYAVFCLKKKKKKNKKIET